LRLILLAVLFLVGLSAIAVAAPRIGNQTQLSFSPGHGTRVAYLASDGRTWLWHPGSAAVLPGDWRLEEGDICFRYPANRANPMTGRRGGVWECVPYELYSLTIIESRNGDPFRLKGRTEAPFALPRKRLSIDQLRVLATGGQLLAGAVD